jgi:hypothetical protein
LSRGLLNFKAKINKRVRKKEEKCAEYAANTTVRQAVRNILGIARREEREYANAGCAALRFADLTL